MTAATHPSSGNSNPPIVCGSPLTVAGNPLMVSLSNHARGLSKDPGAAQGLSILQTKAKVRFQAGVPRHSRLRGNPGVESLC